MIVHPAGKFDNCARPYKHIKARPLAAAMGAEIRGVQLSNLSEEKFAEIRDALFRHKMIYFRDQNISHADHEAFSMRFGAFAEDAYTKGVEGHPNVQPVIKEADVKTGMVFGSGWHTDSPFLSRPPAISMLFGVDIPPFGGDTIWANTVLAYAMLSETMQRMLAPLRVHMSMKRVLQSAQSYARIDDSSLGRLAALRDAATLPEEVVRKVKGAAHPLVRTHPVTGEKSLYCDGTYAVGIEGLTEPESEALLNFLVAHMTQPAFTCRLRWKPKTFVLWDNRICIHQAFNDYDGYRRELYRTTVAGEAPG
jgi:alpha-ketoglutarate-dependent taurine dioxygenase